MDMPGARASTAPFLSGSGQAVPYASRRRQHGFTLVEVVISAGLLGFLALTATFFWVDSFSLVRSVNTDSGAIADGRALLERLAREIREVKFDPGSGVYCVSTMSATQMVFNKTIGSLAAACGGANPTGANNDIAVNIATAGTSVNLGYAGALQPTLTPPGPRLLTSYASSFGMRYLDAGYTVTNSASALRFVELSLTLQPPGVQATQTRTVVALRND
jgi:prepilin-type N-terminal cleavage/methylation domain-containing protein